MMIIEYALCKEDYVEYFAYMYWDCKKKKKQRQKNISMQLLYVFIFCAVLYFTGSFGFNVKYIILSFLLMFCISLLTLISGRSDLVRQATAIADDPENASIFEKILLTITDNDFQIKNKLIETKYTWIAFVNKIETKNYYYLFQNSIQAIIIPKRVFNNPEDKHLFEKILIRNLSLDAEVKESIH